MHENEIINLLIDYGRKCAVLDMFRAVNENDDVPGYALKSVFDALLKGDGDNAGEESEA